MERKLDGGQHMKKYQVTKLRSGSMLDIFTLEFNGDGDPPYEFVSKFVDSLSDKGLCDILEAAESMDGVKVNIVTSEWVEGCTSQTWREVL